MLEPVFDGIRLGLLLSVLVGPVFFALIHSSIEKGFKAGLFFALGILLSDCLYITGANLGIHGILVNEKFKFWVGITGAIVLVIFGITTFLKKPKAPHLAHLKKFSAKKTIMKAFILNSMNPFVFIFWLGVVGVVSMKENYNESHIWSFFGATVATAFSIDLLKAFFAHRIKYFLTHNHLIWLNRISGIAMVSFGIRLLVKMFS